MTYEEAIKNINALNAVCGQKDFYDAEFESALALAIDALEKQIPKKPIAADEQHIRYSMNYICPLCGKHFSGTGIASYCYHCGQALDWNDNITEKGI